jgi:hypothetical protein
LKDVGFAVRDVTSRKTPVYNCVAYAASDETKPWWPSQRPRPGARYYHWPEPNQPATVHSFIKAFHDLGFESCNSGEHEDGYHKVALYVNDHDEPKHMAKEIDGVWYSKLGDEQDIRQHTLEALHGQRYGKAKYFFRIEADG